MALREISVPQQISVLYVQQEVIGDDTLAIDSVLSADVHRSRLLAEETALNAVLQTMEDGDAKDAAEGKVEDPAGGETEGTQKKNRKRDDATARLGEVQKLLVEIDAESGPSRAAELLAGLGFGADDQVRLCCFGWGGNFSWTNVVIFFWRRRNFRRGPSPEDGGCDWLWLEVRFLFFLLLRDFLKS